MRTTSYGLANSILASKELKAPLVILKNVDDGGNVTYSGFIPGIVAEDIIDVSIDQVKVKLEKFAKRKITEMLNNNTPLPFFPNKEEIMKDFGNVVYVKFLRIK